MWFLCSNNPIPIEGEFNIRWEILIPSIRAGMSPAIIYPDDIKLDEVIQEFVNGIMRREQQDNGKVLSKFTLCTIYYCNAKKTSINFRTGINYVSEKDESDVAAIAMRLLNCNTAIVNTKNPSLWHHLALGGVNVIFLVEAGLEPIYHNYVRISVDYKARGVDLQI